MVTKEYWWSGADSKPLKNLRWARPIAGQRGDLLTWLREQEAALERSTNSARIPALENHAAPAEAGEGVVSHRRT